MGGQGPLNFRAQQLKKVAWLPEGAAMPHFWRQFGPPPVAQIAT